MSEKNREHLVFISHSGLDTWVARHIAREVLACGATPFLDEAEIDVGADIEEEIRRALEIAQELVVLVTPWAIERPWVWLELGAAWLRRIPVIGLLHGLDVSELQSRSDVPFLLKKRSLIPLNGINTYLGQLRERIERSAHQEKDAAQ